MALIAISSVARSFVAGTANFTQRKSVGADGLACAERLMQMASAVMEKGEDNET